ncbi:hypothetical protein NLG97_g2079 [Lecanicillium saksenae]|uniref:Uncharacterized protein n=1 Tax=Lecanicillium saksenae TaxID=468837 RepID=A0ACC1R3P3_9HYPO|nr:hypothetical protein NLG97_g2079 [Lecanicillium saksenae]
MFRIHTAPGASVLFDKTFWTNHVVSAAQTYPALWHAALALAAVQQWKSEKDAARKGVQQYNELSSENYVFALKHYNHAIRHILPVASRQTHTYQDKEMILASEIMFFGINSMLDYLVEAAEHAKNAIRLYDLWEFGRADDENASTGFKGTAYSTPRGAVLRKRSLVSLIADLRLQFLNRLDHQFMILRKEARESYQPSAPAGKPLRSTDEAYDEMVLLLTEFLLATKMNAPVQVGILPSQPLSFICHRRFSTWIYKFEQFSQAFACSPPQEGADKYRWRMLTIYVLVMRARLLYGDVEDVHSLDRCAATFYQALEQLERFADDWHGEPPAGTDSSQPAGFSFSMSMAEICYCIATGCREHDLRCRAVALLRRWGVCDGMWDSNLMAALIEVTMQVEDEAGIANESLGAGVEPPCPCAYRKFVCGQHRIWAKQVRVGNGREALFSYSLVEDVTSRLPMRTRKIMY